MDLKRLGRLGVWSWLDMFTAPEAAAFAQRIEALGYSMLWIPEAVGRDPFALATYLSTKTTKLVFATGIANIYARDPMTMDTLRRTVGELSGGRFVLGIGVSHAHLVQGIRKHDYGKPVATMRAYLEGMKGKPYMAPPPPSEPPIVLAALRKNMLGLARDATAGAHPYFTTPEHTARAREILGPDAWLAPEMMCCRETDAAKARAAARAVMQIYLGLPNYQNNLRWLGFGDEDFANGGSDRVVDAVVAWGDTDAIRARIEAHWKAGADHVCIQPFRSDGERAPDAKLLEDLAPGRG
jgi:probable F420-dependent oxidoreductase